MPLFKKGNKYVFKKKSKSATTNASSTTPAKGKLNPGLAAFLAKKNAGKAPAKA